MLLGKTGGEEEIPVQKWEYITIEMLKDEVLEIRPEEWDVGTPNLLSNLNAMGVLGWEMASVVPTETTLVGETYTTMLIILKRPISRKALP